VPGLFQRSFGNHLPGVELASAYFRSAAFCLRKAIPAFIAISDTLMGTRYALVPAASTVDRGGAAGVVPDGSGNCL
jgi:hypothetical protein